MRYFWQKIILTVPMSMFVLEQRHYMVIWGLIIMMIIDTILGLWVSVKLKVFASYKLGRIAAKVSKYFLALMSVWILSCVEPMLLGWTFQGLGVFLMLTEAFSNFEKLAILGLNIPNQFLAKLNKDFNDYYFGDEKKSKKALKRILNKKQATKEDN